MYMAYKKAKSLSTVLYIQCNMCFEMYNKKAKKLKLKCMYILLQYVCKSIVQACIRESTMC